MNKPFENPQVVQLAGALTEKSSLNRDIIGRLAGLDALMQQRARELQLASDKLETESAARLQAEQALHLSDERFAKVFKASSIPLAILSSGEMKFAEVNEGFLAVTGYDIEELIDHSPAELRLWDEREAESAMLRKLRKEMSVHKLPCRFRHKSGRVMDILLSADVIELDGEPALLMIAQDVSEQVLLQNQLQQARKMEAVGQLAAGVAHDFNNILTVVQGNASLMQALKQPGSDDWKPLQNICAATERASRLVRQLLTFSRQQPLELQPVNLRDTLAAVSDVLPRILTERVKVALHAPPNLPEVSADSAMLETLLMNLAFNARDAMPEGGHLRITAETVELGDPAAGGNAQARPGNFVCVTVKDTGSGIAKDILPHIFEPFFTTKPVGKGTGLGLATVYGITRQHKGWVDVQSELDHGTTFRVFLPALAAARPTKPVVKASPKPPAPARAGRETILVVEDEPDLRDLVAQVLESRNYNVLTASSGAKALETWARREGEIHLLLTDMVMPDGLTGRKLAERLTGEDPRLRVLFTSGYTAGMPGSDLENVAEGSFLPKPYRPATLLQVVRDCLDRPACRAAAA
jgi:two-component system, cell cycle sensor histidine kinase and response regulator CckA